MVHRFMDNSADESQIGTLTGLLVRCCASLHSAVSSMPRIFCPLA